MKRELVSFAAFSAAVGLLDSSFYEAVAFAFSLYAFLRFIDQLGQYIALPACIGFIATLEVLLVPAVTYWIFPASMPLESATYFSYALPACLAFYGGLQLFDRPAFAVTHRAYSQLAAAYIQQRPSAAVALFLIGLAGFLLKYLVPDLPAFLGTLPAYCLLISAFYTYYSAGPYRILSIAFVSTLLLASTVQTGMFGDLFFWLLFLLLFLSVSLPNPLTTRSKVIVICLAVVCLILIQSIKREYRYHTWGQQRGERTANAGLMADLITDRLSHPEKLLNVGHLFRSVVRFNQGIMIGSAMAKVPVQEAYAGGEVLLSLVYPLVPRLLWSGKPQTGGYENIRRFTSLPQFENTSINLSPVGEGYVNFGYGGILFSLFYGLLISGCFRAVFLLADHIPSVVLWIPMLYMGCLTMETDLLSTWGSLVNSALFIMLLFWSFRQIGIEL